MEHIIKNDWRNRNINSLVTVMTRQKFYSDRSQDKKTANGITSSRDFINHRRFVWHRHRERQRQLINFFLSLGTHCVTFSTVYYTRSSPFLNNHYVYHHQPPRNTLLTYYITPMLIVPLSPTITQTALPF